MRYFLLVSMLLLSGCWSGQLKRIVVTDRDGYMTVGDTLYKAKNLKGAPDIQEHHLAWQESPPTLNRYDDKRLYALLLHESCHSDQMKGPVKYFTVLLCYPTSAEFRWQMESAAYKIEIETLVRLGAWAGEQDVNDFAAMMSGKNYRGMTNYDDARKWVAAIAQGATR